MNFAVKNDDRRSFLVAGQESHCQLYYVNPKIVSQDDEDAEIIGKNNNSMPEKPFANGLRKRLNSSSCAEDVEEKNKPKTSTKNDINSNMKKIRFDIKAGDSIQTDFLSSEPIQRVVRISPNGKLMATGGTDGHVRMWLFPKMATYSDIS